MELRHLRYFVAVAEELNFTRAAERLHIAQPPLSMQIRDLEGEIGACLFTRSRRTVALTEAGRALLVHAREILAQTTEAAEAARRAARGETGVLRIGFTSSLPYAALLPDALFAYRQRCPDVTLQLRELFTSEQFEALANGTLDVGLVRESPATSPRGVSVRELGRDPLRVVIHADHALAQQASVSIASLREEGFISFPPGVGTGLPAILVRLSAAAGFEPRIVQLAREATTQIALVAAGLGIALLPAPLEYMRIPRVRYLPIDDAGADLPLSLALPSTGATGRTALQDGFVAVLDRLAGTAFRSR